MRNGGCFRFWQRLRSGCGMTATAGKQKQPVAVAGTRYIPNGVFVPYAEWLGRLIMIELEFLDEPNPLERFFRFGSDPSGMVMPIKVILAKEDV